MATSQTAAEALKLVGDGPLAAPVREAAKNDPMIQWLGNVPLETVYALVGQPRLNKLAIVGDRAG